MLFSTPWSRRHGAGEVWRRPNGPERFSRLDVGSPSLGQPGRGARRSAKGRPPIVVSGGTSSESGAGPAGPALPAAPQSTPLLPAAELVSKPLSGSCLCTETWTVAPGPPSERRDPGANRNSVPLGQKPIRQKEHRTQIACFPALACNWADVPPILRTRPTPFPRPARSLRLVRPAPDPRG